MSRVLIVDNPPLFRTLDASFIRRAGWEIVSGRETREIVARASDGEPDLILLDTSTPGFDAPACILALKTTPPTRSIPLLVLSDPALTRACESAGADATLAHPVPAAALEAALCSMARVTTRDGRRRVVRAAARVDTPDGTLHGRVKDISRSGAFLALQRPLPIDSTVQLALRLPLPGPPREIQARGVVVRQVPDDRESHLVAGVGVRFTGVDATSESLIDRYVDLDVGRDAVDAPTGEGDSE
jgi:two-component system cell cycle response regulator DivK